VLSLPEKTYTPKGNGVQGKIMSIGAVLQNGEWYNQPVMLKGLDNTQSLIDHSSKTFYFLPLFLYYADGGTRGLQEEGVLQRREVRDPDTAE